MRFSVGQNKQVHLSIVVPQSALQCLGVQRGDRAIAHDQRCGSLRKVRKAGRIREQAAADLDGVTALA